MDISTFIFSVGAVIVGLVQVAKTTGLPDRLVPLTALLLGVGFALAAGSQHAIAPAIDDFQLILAGLTTGLTAVGLHGGVKATLGQ